MKLEVIVFDKESMIAAQEGGATQVELITDLDNDGLTPSLQTVKEVLEVATIPVHVMVRNSNTFQHDAEEHSKHLEFIKELKELNVPAIVWGSLDEENKVNESQVKDILEATGKDMKLIFHRAADFARCPIEAWTTLKELGVKHILTSGGPNKAIEGLDMIHVAMNNIEDVLIGAGISAENVEEIVKDTNNKQVHVGTSVWAEKEVIDPSKVREIRDILDNL